MMQNGVILTKAATIAEIARQAGVSKATVDRVLNNRSNVSDTTRQRVLQAKSAIENGNVPVQRARPWRIKVILPRDAGPSTEFLADCLREMGVQGNATVECIFTQKMEPSFLTRKLKACLGQGIDAVAFQALDHPRVRDAVNELAAQGIPSISLLSNIEGASVIGYVGIDNRAGGRTAGFLMGRMLREDSKTAIISGGQLYRSHEEREMGFRAVLRTEFPDMEVVGAYSGVDDSEDNYRVVRKLLKERPDLAGLYNVGGGNQGIVRALKEADRDRDVLLIGHNLTSKTRAYLLDRTMDVVIHQNMRDAAHAAIDSLLHHLTGNQAQTRILPIEIITLENTRGAVFGG